MSNKFFEGLLTMKGMFELIMTFFRWLPIGSVPEVDAVALAEIIHEQRPIQVLDVRTHGEWGSGHIMGAVSVPITRLNKQIMGLPFKKNMPVVAICLSGHRSIPAVRLLKRYGYQNVKQLKGGMRSWHRLNGNRFLESNSTEAV